VVTRLTSVGPKAWASFERMFSSTGPHVAIEKIDV
jgi:hypothetical protein